MQVNVVSGEPLFASADKFGPSAHGDLRYCINSASLRLIHRNDMEEEGYGTYLSQAGGKS